MVTTYLRVLVAASLSLLMPAVGAAQQGGKQAFEFRGKVEKVDEKTKRLTVDHENIEGWMKAMKMIYKVDVEGVLKTLKAGDRITATVYAGDFETLYQVQRVPPGAQAETQKK